MRDPFRPLPVVMAIVLFVAVGLMSVSAFGQGPEGARPAGTLRAAPPHVVPHPGLPGARPVVRPLDAAAQRAPLVDRFAAVRDQLVRWIRETALKLLSDNQTNLLSGNSPKLLSDNQPEVLSRNSPKLLSENEPKILSNNKTQVLSGNQTPILSGNRISLFSGLKIEIHVENSNNNNANHNLPPPAHPAK